MTDPRMTLSKVDLHVALWALAVAIGSIFFFDRAILLGALLGGAIATLNWLGFRWAGVRIAATEERGRFFVFLAVKTMAVLGVVALVLATGAVNAFAFVVGLSSLVAGILSRSAAQALAEGEAALEEQE